MENGDLISVRLKKVMAKLIGEQIINNQQDIVNLTGYNKSSVSQAMNNKNGYLTPDFIEKICQVFPMVSKDYIINGIKPELITESSNKTETQEKVMVSDVVSYKQSEGKPYYDVDFINGFKDVEEITNTNPDYNINYPPAEHCDFWANATGYSMQGHINHGDTVAFKQVSTDWFPLGEVYGIVTTNNYRMIKRISKSNDSNCYRLVSSNPDKSKYPDQDIPKNIIKHLFKIICAIKIIN